MGVVLLFLGVIAAVAAWWLWRHGLADKPWLEVGVAGDLPGAGAPLHPAPLHPAAKATAAKVGLGVFLAVAGSLFALFISAYSMRMQFADWRPLPDMGLLWVNTGVLILASAALQGAQVSAQRERIDGVRAGLAVGGVSTLAFVFGQLVVWQQLAAAGFLAPANPANAFFYLVTAAHGLHVLGGLAALGRVFARVWPEPDGDPDRVRLGVELCALYWHFLLLVWVVLFGMLAMTALPDWLYAICFGT
ncbi:MAG TPA: cytochrome c oxidase subunit 3 [Azospirillaceae bacterium]|nr:cytochrome c oxidase subunit 3 [Azospirillaceae bacterium]